MPVSADAGAVLGLDAFVEVPHQIVVKVVDTLVLVVAVVVELLFEPAEEALGGVVRRAGPWRSWNVSARGVRRCGSIRASGNGIPGPSG